MKSSMMVIGLSVVAVVLALLLAFFLLGTPQAPVSVEDGGAATSESGPGHGDMGSTVTTGEVPPPDPDSPLAVEIPGCICHSDDPEVVEEHANYRMNQCFGCHADGMPEMGG